MLCEIFHRICMSFRVTRDRSWNMNETVISRRHLYTGNHDRLVLFRNYYVVSKQHVFMYIHRNDSWNGINRLTIILFFSSPSPIFFFSSFIPIRINVHKCIMEFRVFRRQVRGSIYGTHALPGRRWRVLSYVPSVTIDGPLRHVQRG